jgi:hypothetical protein
MAGSISYGAYRADDNRVYSIKLDKSNMRAVHNITGEPLISARDANYPPLPCGLKPRFLYAYDRANPKRKRRFYVDTTVPIRNGTYDGSTYIITQDDQALWLVTGYVGEAYLRLPIYYGQDDTGLTDGTVSQ